MEQSIPSILAGLALVGAIYAIYLAFRLRTDVKKAQERLSSVDDQVSDEELYDEAVRVVRETGKASAAYIQRRLSTGYARAARLLDMMEERGVVGPGEGASPREVLVDQVRPIEKAKKGSRWWEFNIRWWQLILVGVMLLAAWNEVVIIEILSLVLIISGIVLLINRIYHRVLVGVGRRLAGNWFKIWLASNWFRVSLVIFLICFALISRTYLRDKNQIEAKTRNAECRHRAFNLTGELESRLNFPCDDIKSYKLKTENKWDIGEKDYSDSWWDMFVDMLFKG